MEKHSVGISVRDLISFILREGDIDNRVGGGSDPDLLQIGSRLHRKIQKQMGSGYQAEVSLKLPVYVMDGSVYYEEPVTEQAEKETPKVDNSLIETSDEENLRKEHPKADVEQKYLEICLDGRADGVYMKNKRLCIDEIKAVNRDVEHITEPDPLHLAQVKCYAFMYAMRYGKWPKLVQVTYCQMETEQIRRLEYPVKKEELTKWFETLVLEYSKWIFRSIRWEEHRNLTLKQLDFPFEYREGQFQLVGDVYRTIQRKKQLYLEAPTGVGKTISTVFPSVKAMGEKLISKIFYLTAKTITRKVAEDTFSLLKEKGTELKCVTLTAKDKICIFDHADCNPESCERAKGHYDRVNDAVFDLINHEEQINRLTIEQYAKKHNVCPFEMSLDTATWADVIIGDYNYAFDPEAKLKRFFAEGAPGAGTYQFLVDESHNLVERAREMYSATLKKEDFLTVKKMIGLKDNRVTKRLEICNRDFLSLKRECEGIEIIKQIDTQYFHIFNLQGAMDEFLRDNRHFKDREVVLDFYFDLCKFIQVYEYLDDKYIIYSEVDERGEFLLHLQCMDPSERLGECLRFARSSIFFSATLLPVRYYREQLGGRDEDYAVYAPSSFPKENRLVMVARDVSTRYKRRNRKEYEKILTYIHEFIHAKAGNYLVFFPSYEMLTTMAQMWEEMYEADTIRVVLQNSNMSEEQREEFLANFSGDDNIVGFCVLGGIFGEGIDLVKEQLIGAAIVGTGLPMVCRERKLYQDYFSGKGKDGFQYAYLYPGMNKVMQAAGRVIRTMEDRGSILLLDERFLQQEYQRLFPNEWYPFYPVNIEYMKQVLKEFWEETT